MNRRGAVLLVVLLALLVTGALASAALAVARYRWLAGVRLQAAVRAELSARAAVEAHRATLDPAMAFRLLPGETVALGPADTLTRLSERHYQLRSWRGVRLTDGTVQGEAGAALLLRLEGAEVTGPPPALQPAGGPVDGMGTPFGSPRVAGFGQPVMGGRWRLP